MFQDNSSKYIFCGHIPKELAKVLFNGFLSEEMQDVHQNIFANMHSIFLP